MQPIDWSPTRCGHRVFALGLVVLLAGTMFASVAAADAAMGFRDAEVSATTVTVGENVTVSAEAVNVGDSGGGYTFTFESNQSICGTTYCVFDEQRVSIPADQDRRVTSNVSFDEPGTYKIRVSGSGAGVVRVESARAQVASTTESQRRIDLRAHGVPADEPIDFDVPASNRTFAVQNWSTTTGQSSFQQYLTEYTNRSEMPEPVPSPGQSTLLGVIDFESEDGYEESTMRIGINDSELATAMLSREAVTVYQRNGSAWEPLSTRVTDERADRTVYEATATRGSTYAVGRIEPSISVANTTVQTSGTETGQLLTVEGVLRNTGPVAGSCTGAMRVNGETVNRTTVTVPASGDTTITLSHEITQAGTYNVRLNDSGRTTVIVAESQVGTPQPGGSPTASPAGPGTAAATGTATATGPAADGGSAADALPSTILGINTLYVVGGLAVALGAFVVILLLLRRGGDGGGGRPDNFDPW